MSRKTRTKIKIWIIYKEFTDNFVCIGAKWKGDISRVNVDYDFWRPEKIRVLLVSWLTRCVPLDVLFQSSESVSSSIKRWKNIWLIIVNIITGKRTYVACPFPSCPFFIFWGKHLNNISSSLAFSVFLLLNFLAECADLSHFRERSSSN